MGGRCDTTTTVEADTSLPQPAVDLADPGMAWGLTREHLGTLGPGARQRVDFGAELVELDTEGVHVHLLIIPPPQVALAVW
jgi:hypothetical protein